MVFISWLLALAQPVCAAAPPALHLTQAELWHSPSGSWAPPDTLTHSDDAVLEAATPWQTVALPHARPRAVATPAKAAQAPPQVAQAAAGGLVPAAGAGGGTGGVAAGAARSHPALADFGLPDEWFAWLAYVAGSMGSALCSFLFLCVINQLRLPRLKAAMLLYVGAACLITLPPLGLLELNTALPALRLALIPPGLVMIGVGVWGAIQRRTWGSALLALWLLLSLPIGFHDLGLQSYRGDIESIYLTPYVYVGLFTMFLLIAYTRYVRALDVAAQANATLERRLAEREAELAASHERLRQVEREQTLMTERQRLMREMHDGMGSSLMTALRVIEHGERDRVDVAQVLKECIDDLKISIDSLEPLDADLLALLATLRFRLGPRLEGAGLALHRGPCTTCRPCPGWTHRTPCTCCASCRRC